MQRNNIAILSALLLALCLGFLPAAGCGEVDENNGSMPNGNNEIPGGGNGDTGDVPVEPVRGNSGGNIVNGGLVASRGDYIYFSSRIDGEKLYRARPDGSEPLRLTDEGARYINVTGEYIYYVAMGEPERFYDDFMDEEVTYAVHGPVVRVNLDGGGRTVISPDAARYLQLSGDWLYYTKADEPYYLYRVKTDGSKRAPLTDYIVGQFVLDGDWIYHVGVREWSKLYQMRIDGSELAELYRDSTYSLNFMDGRLYFVGDIFAAGAYVGGERLYQIDLESTELSHVGHIEPLVLNAVDGWIYYISAWGGPIYKCLPDGSEPVVLTDDQSTGVFLAGQWLYYINTGDEGRLYRVGTDGSGRQRIE